MSTTVPAFTDEFRTTIVEFAKDLSTTFPEYASALEMWTQEDISDFDMQDLFEHCLKVYPERFFDIIKQSSAMFENTSIDLHFFPDVDFRVLLTSEGVTPSTRESIWKYLQVVLLILVKSMESKVEFGEAMNIFDNIDVNELQDQLRSTITGISQFFEKMEEPKQERQETEETQETQETRETQGEEKPSRSVPNMENIQDHLQSLFNGKIGKLAKELADDMSEDLSKTFGKDMENIHSTKDVLDAIMKDPSKMGNVVNTVKDKLTEKMESGDITKEDLVSEASEMMNKMKGLGGMGGMGGGGMANMAQSMANGDMADLMQSIGGNASMFQDLAKSMGMKIPKGSKLNTSAMEAQQKKISLKERLRNRAIAKKQEEVAKKMEEVLQQRKREEEYNKMIQDNPDLADFEKLVFSLEGEEKQEKSAVRDPNELSASQKKRMKKKARKQKHEQEKATKTV